MNTWGIIKGLEAVKGDLSGNQKALQQALGQVTLPAPSARSSSTRTARR